MVAGARNQRDHNIVSAAHVLIAGAIDRRVKCVVSQVPPISGHRNARCLIRADMVAATPAMFAEERKARYAGKPHAMYRRRVERSAYSLRSANAGLLRMVCRDG